MYKEKVDTCGNRIAEALRTKGMRQSELCKLANVPKSSLSLYLSGAYDPKQNRIHDMAVVLNVSEAWLLGYDVPMERQESKKRPPEPLVLSEGEKMLLDLFNKVPKDKQELVLQMIRVALGSQE